MHGGILPAFIPRVGTLEEQTLDQEYEYRVDFGYWLNRPHCVVQCSTCVTALIPKSDPVEEIVNGH